MSKQQFGSDFNKSPDKAPKKLVEKKELSISRDYEFSNITTTNSKNRQGRPIKFIDKRYKATMPKRVSPVVNLKLEILKPYISELSKESGEISFNTVLDNLIESYIHQRLSATKEEFIRNEISEELKKLPK